MVFSIGRFRSLLSIREQASFLLVAALALGWIACADSVSAEEGKTGKSNPNVMWLQGGDIYRGGWVPSQKSSEVTWQSPSFLEPIAFPWDAVQLIRVGDRANKEEESVRLGRHPFSMELKSGEVISGDLISIQQDQIEIEVRDLGKLSVPIAQVRNLVRVAQQGKDSVQILRAEEWEQILPATRNGRATKWYLKAGEISTDTSGTTISQWMNLPELATIDIDVVWDQASPNWWLTLGEPRRMEVQVRKLQSKKLLNITMLLENSADADVTTIQLPYEEDQSIKLRLLCDAAKGVYVLMRENQILGRLKGNTTERFVGRTKVSFTNTALGVLTLRDLRISSSAFALPAETLEDSQIEWMTRDRGTFLGKIVGGDRPAASNDGTSDQASEGRSVNVQWLDQSPKRLGFDEIARVEFPNQGAPRDSIDATSSKIIQVELQNGSRFATEKLSSYLVDGVAGIEVEVLGKRLRFPIDEIKQVARRPAVVPQATSENDASLLRMVTDDVVSLGKVVGVKGMSDSKKTFTWFPRLATGAVPLNPRADGAIEPILPNPSTSQKKSKTNSPPANVRADTPPNENDIGRPLKPEDPSLFLVNGDCFPAFVRRGDVGELIFESALFPKQSIEQALVRGVRFVDYRGIDKLDRTTKNRLMTLPRLQRKNPPTHMVVSRDGDLLRGRLVRFDRDNLVMDIRGEERTILVKNIAELVTLDSAPKLESRESEEEGNEAKEPKAEGGTEAAPDDGEMDGKEPIQEQDVYQIILDQGARVSLVPDEVDSDQLKGRHPQLGECILPWSNVARISLGDAIAVDASRNRYGKWKLQHAKDPKYVTDPDGGNDRPNDTPQMRMIGQGAPDFDLKKVDGTPFQLKEYRGKIVILDFWATWCGPCIRSIPSLIEISKEYKNAEVELVLVNVEEPENRVRPFLQRLQSIPTVVLDRDGTVSKQYNVSAIPQTVLVDRDGGIVDVFVGASDENEATLRKKIDGLLKQ